MVRNQTRAARLRSPLRPLHCQSPRDRSCHNHQGLGRSGRAVADRMGFTGNYIDCGIPSLPASGACELKGKPARHILYATSAYDWHGYFDIASRQREQVDFLAKLLGPDRLRLRIHPRDNPDQYQGIDQDSSRDLAPETVPRAVLSMSSTYTFDMASRSVPSFFLWPDGFHRSLNVDLTSEEWSWLRPFVLSESGLTEDPEQWLQSLDWRWRQDQAVEGLGRGIGVGGPVAVRVIADAIAASVGSV